MPTKQSTSLVSGQLAAANREPCGTAANYQQVSFIGQLQAVIGQ